MNGKTYESVRTGCAYGLEFWNAVIQADAEGISLCSYKCITDDILSGAGLYSTGCTIQPFPWKHFYLPAYGTWRAGIPNSCILKNLESGMHTKKRDGGSAILFFIFPFTNIHAVSSEKMKPYITNQDLNCCQRKRTSSCIPRPAEPHGCPAAAAVQKLLQPCQKFQEKCYWFSDWNRNFRTGDNNFRTNIPVVAPKPCCTRLSWTCRLLII